ncbi:hypothetical protein AUG19_08490 [archaeon 13_1_20CM_2_54_9]|nr:MAG: hypothetical protein AUG19_08490 [archaeon 13_1_20CM_2_54_9]
MVVSMVLGVCFISLTLQGTLLTIYARRKFPRRQVARSFSKALNEEAVLNGQHKYQKLHALN